MAKKRILIVISEWGFRGEELIGPLETFDRAGYEVQFVTPTGRRPLALPVSTDPTFVDPPLGKIVVSPEMAHKVKEIRRPDRSDPSIDASNLGQQVRLLRATLAKCKGIADRREHRLVAAVVALVFLGVLMLAFNRTQLQTAMIEWVPTLGARQPREGVGAAYNAYQKREYELALRLAHPLAEQSDARAQSLLGLIYHFGRGVERNESEALKWFRRAAKATRLIN